MRKTLTAAAVLVALAIAAPIGAGTPRAAQHIRIEASGANTQTFVLTPDDIGPDSGGHGSADVLLLDDEPRRACRPNAWTSTTRT